MFEDLGAAEAQRRREYLSPEEAVERVGQLPGHDIAAEPVDDRYQVHEAVWKRQVGDVRARDLIRLADLQTAQQVRLELVTLARDRRLWLGIDGLQADELHQTLEMTISVGVKGHFTTRAFGVSAGFGSPLPKRQRANRPGQALVCIPLEQVTLRAARDRSTGLIGSFEAGEHDDSYHRHRRAHPRGNLETAAIEQVHVQQHYVRDQTPSGPQSALSIRRFADHFHIRTDSQQVAQATADGRMIVDYQDTDTSGLRSHQYPAVSTGACLPCIAARPPVALRSTR